MEKISFNSNGIKISALLIKPKNITTKSPGLLFFHGWGSKKERYIDRAEELVKLGFIALIPDFPGHGKSQGNIKKMTKKDFLDASVAAYDYLMSLSEIDKNKIGVHGSSFGGYFSILLSSKRDLKWLDIKNPANYPKDMQDKPMSVFKILASGEWNNSYFNPRQNSAIAALNNFDGEVLLIQSEKDDMIPKEVFDTYLKYIKNKSRLKHIIIKDADHRTSKPEWERKSRKAQYNWFQKILE